MTGGGGLSVGEKDVTDSLDVGASGNEQKPFFRRPDHAQTPTYVLVYIMVVFSLAKVATGVTAMDKLLGLQITTGGLRKMNSQDASDNISACVVFGHKENQLYLDHDQSYMSIDWDDVVVFPVNDLPPLISPRKVKEEKIAERMVEHNMTEEQGDDNVEKEAGNMADGQCDEQQLNEEEI
ncbi:Ubiquitin carboxyl-terminal hydrolase 13 [Hordeum vulgare]|nr:Ubiquitin carboxyl-terminal hydrolase 13 [Hordeum vulgare]